MMPPCKDCVERHTACHDQCRKFKEYKLEREAEKAYTKRMNENTHESNYDHRADMRSRRWYKKYFGGLKG